MRVRSGSSSRPTCNTGQPKIQANLKHFGPEGLGWPRLGGLPNYYAQHPEEWPSDLAQVEDLRRRDAVRAKAEQTLLPLRPHRQAHVHRPEPRWTGRPDRLHRACGAANERVGRSIQTNGRLRGKGRPCTLRDCCRTILRPKRPCWVRC